MEGITEIPTGGLVFTIHFTDLVMGMVMGMVLGIMAIVTQDTEVITVIDMIGVMLGLPILEDPHAIRIQTTLEEVVLLNTTPNPIILVSTKAIRAQPIRILRVQIDTTLAENLKTIIPKLTPVRV